jgi:predicted dehydrogenase
LTVGKDHVELAVSNLTDGEGVDAVLITAATNDNKPILLSEAIARRRGRIVLVGVAEILLTRKMFWDKELSFTVSKASGPSAEEYRQHPDFPSGLVRWTERRNLEEFLRLVSSGFVNVHDLITHRFTIENAIKAYDLILKGKERYIGVLITYPASASVGDVKVSREPAKPKRDLSGNQWHIGIIGAGMFTKNILLPALKKIDGVALEGISARTGLSASHLAETFDFRYSTSEYQEILSDPAVGSVIVTTPHNLHGAMVREGLRAAKNVFVEKPLCITEDELLALIKKFTAEKFPAMFMVGFNRNYSPLSVSLREMLRQRTSPFVAHFRVNAGFIPQEHWTQDPLVGGGRIIGEVCHFVEFLRFLSVAEPIEVFAESIGGRTGKFSREDNISVSIRFSDGSLGSILYTALGSKVASRERIEVFSDESVYVLEDFRSLEIIKGSRKERRRLRNQNMGYVEELRAFFGGSPEDGLRNFLQAASSTKATFAIVESLRNHSPITIK